MQAGDAAAAISRAALAGSDDICIETLDCFVRLYGAEAGNLALKTMSRGGVVCGRRDRTEDIAVIAARPFHAALS